MQIARNFRTIAMHNKKIHSIEAFVLFALQKSFPTNLNLNIFIAKKNFFKTTKFWCSLMSSLFILFILDIQDLSFGVSTKIRRRVPSCSFSCWNWEVRELRHYETWKYLDFDFFSSHLGGGFADQSHHCQRPTHQRAPLTIPASLCISDSSTKVFYEKVSHKTTKH